MNTKENKESTITSFIIWLVWVVVVIGILSSVVYLFVGGSVLFTKSISEPLVLYSEVRDGQLSLSGSIMKPSVCHALSVATGGDKSAQNIALTFQRVAECDNEVAGSALETFFVELEGDESTVVTATVDSIKRDILIK